MEKWEIMLKGQEKAQIQNYLHTNSYTQGFGLSLTEEDAKQLVIAHQKTLKEKQRFEFGEGILSKLIFAFCDSSYINQAEYKETLIELEEIFYEYKNESKDLITDDELVEYMAKTFEGECCGSIEYLRGTALAKLIRKIRMEHDGIWQEEE